MKKHFLGAFAALAMLSAPAIAADPFTDLTSMTGAIKGTMDITFNTRLEFDDTGKVPDGSPALGATDDYKIDLVVFDSVVIQGEANRLPWLPTSVLGRTYQNGHIAYDLNLMLRNPKNPQQVVKLGKWTGGMSLDGGGLYSLDVPPEGFGEMRIAIDTFGDIKGFTSEFGGKIQGRVPEQAGLWGLADRATKKVTKTYTRYIDGKAVSTTIEGADPMQFIGTTVAQGPLATYPETRVVGSVDYDPETGNWFVDLTAGYSANGVAMTDRYSGTISWNEDPNREQNGKGWYQVNIQVNEQQVTEDAVFSASAEFSEDSFFSADASVPGFTGTISYVDTIEDESVVKSKVIYAIDANSASKIQAMNLAKVLLEMIGPFNDE